MGRLLTKDERGASAQAELPDTYIIMHFHRGEQEILVDGLVNCLYGIKSGIGEYDMTPRFRESGQRKSLRFSIIRKGI